MSRASSKLTICRTCLAPGRLQPIFPQELGAVDYSQLIETYSGIKVEKEDGFPQSMCFACVHLLKSAAYFSKIARQSDERLRGFSTAGVQHETHSVKTEPDGESSKVKHEVRGEDTTDDEHSADDFLDTDSDTSTSANNQSTTHYADDQSDKDPDEDKKLIELVKAKKKIESTVEKRKSNLRKMVKQMQRKEGDAAAASEPWRDIAKIVMKTEPKIINRGDKEWRTRVRAIFRVSGASASRHIECRLCGITLKQPSSMHVHAQKHLGYRVICEACGKGFPNNCALQQHCMNRHGLKKSFSCSHCPFTSAVKFELTVHERTHTGERPFICDTCGSSFYRRRCLIVHTRSHSDTRPYKCTNCEKRFISRGDMMAHHNAVHQRRYVFPCPVCGHTYARRTTVYKHVAAQHDVRVDRNQVTKIYL